MGMILHKVVLHVYFLAYNATMPIFATLVHLVFFTPNNVPVVVPPQLITTPP